MPPELFSSVTFWLVVFVAGAAALARILHIVSAGSSVLSGFRQASREDALERASLDAQQRFRDGYAPTMEDDLADALRSTPFSPDDGPEMIAPGMEAMPDTWPPEPDAR